VGTGPKPALSEAEGTPSGPSKAQLAFGFEIQQTVRMSTGRATLGLDGSETRRFTARSGSHVRAYLSAGFYYHRRPVCQHFRNALHHFGCVVTGADHGVSTQFSRVLQHQVESLGPRLLA